MATGCYEGRGLIHKAVLWRALPAQKHGARAARSMPAKALGASEGSVQQINTTHFTSHFEEG